MSASKFVVVKEWAIGKESEKVLEFILACKPGETRDELASRYLTTIKYRPPVVVEKPIKPEIKSLLPPDAPRPGYDQAAIDAAAKLEPSLVAQFAKSHCLAKILSLELAVFSPARMTTDFWFSASTAAKNKKFATTA